MRKGIIVGFDPGTTSGLAILDVYGNVISVISKRDLKKSEIVTHITKFGSPLIVASDVSPTPKSVEKLASIFGSKIFFPEESLSVMEKQLLIENYESFVKNNHEIDALSAAIKSWKTYRNLFSKVEYTLQKSYLMGIFDGVILRLLKDNSDNIDDAVNKVLYMKRKVLPEIPKKKLSVQEYEELIKNLQARLEQKEGEIRRLILQSDNLNKALRNVKNELKKESGAKIDFNRMIELELECEKLIEANRLLRNFIKIEEAGFVPIIDIEKVSNDKLEDLESSIGLNNCVLCCHSTENLNLLNRFTVKAVIVDNLPDNVEKLEFPILLLDNKEIEVVDGMKAMKKEVLERELNNVRKSGLVEWLKDYRERKE